MGRYPGPKRRKRRTATAPKVKDVDCGDEIPAVAAPTSASKCLICDATNDTRSLNTLTEKLVNNECESSRGTVNLDGELYAILLIRKVLCLKRTFLEYVLQKSGSNPSSWELQLCGVCFRIFEEASFVWNRIRKLNVEFEELSERLRSKISHSYGLDGSLEPVITKKRVGRPSKRVMFQLSGDTGSDNNEEPQISDEIREEFIRTQNGGFLQDERNRIDLTAIRCNVIQNKMVSNSNPTSSPTTNAECTDETNCMEFDDYTGAAGSDDHSSDMEHFEDSASTSAQFDNGLDENDEINEDHQEGDNSDALIQRDINPGSYSDNELSESEPHPSGESDSEYEPDKPAKRSKPSQRRRSNATSGRTRAKVSIIRAMKRENDHKYECVKCSQVFEDSSLCNEHILQDHYRGKWPLQHTCSICEDLTYSREHDLRVHLKMRHPGVNLPSDEQAEESLQKEGCSELSYDVIPFKAGAEGTTSAVKSMEGGTAPDGHANTSKLAQRLELPSPESIDEKPITMPILKINGDIRKIVLSPMFSRLPKEALEQLIGSSQELPCHLCERKYLVPVQLQGHIQKSHKGEKYSYTCPMCPKKFERIGHMLLHMKATHVSGKLYCDICGNMFKEAILLDAHIQRYHFGIEHPYKCIKCGIRYPRRSTLNKHLKKAHKLQIDSSSLLIRNPTSKVTGSMGKPSRVPRRGVGHHRVGPGRPRKDAYLIKSFACEICENERQEAVKFATEEELDVHVKRTHMGISRPYACTICSKKYSRPQFVEDHMHTHTVRNDVSIIDAAPAKEYICVPCNKEFISKPRFEHHMNGRHHKNIRPFVCELCSKSFRALRYLEFHQSQKHFEELHMQPNKCKYCGKLMSSPRTLGDHIRVHHTKDANFNCPHCTSRFQYQSGLDKHINVMHAKIQKFLCPHCPKAFPVAQYLTNHMRLHTGEKPYECHICRKKFSDRSTYNRHVEAHKGKIHECPISACRKQYITRHAFRTHLKQHQKKGIMVEIPEIPSVNDDQAEYENSNNGSMKASGSVLHDIPFLEREQKLDSGESNTHAITRGSTSSFEAALQNDPLDPGCDTPPVLRPEVADFHTLH